MSGPKKADVQRKLDRAIMSIDSQVKEMEEGDRRFQELADHSAASSLADAYSAMSSLDQIQSQLSALDVPLEKRSRIEKKINEAKSEFHRAEKTIASAELEQADAIRKQETASRELAECLGECDRLMNAIRYKAHYLHTEDTEAERLRDRAMSALQIQKQVGKTIRKSADETRTARNLFDTVSALVTQIRRDSDHVIEDAQRRAAAQRIAEENQRDATQQHGSLLAATGELSKLNHQKFSPGGLDQLRSRIDQHAQLFTSGNYSKAKMLGDAIVPQMQALLDDVQQKQMDWTNAKNAASNDLHAVLDEVQTIDRSKLDTWTGDSVAVDASYDMVESAKVAFENEDFARCQIEVASAVKSIRDFSSLSEQNERQSRQRQEIAEAIMQTLYDQNYDAPQWYLAGQTADGHPDPLSGLVVFAKSPGEKGDMRMSIDLSGTVVLEVQNIPEGEEGMCQKLITGLQQGLAGEVNFAMTDWGRAANVKAGPLNVPKARTQQQDRTIERERE